MVVRPYKLHTYPGMVDVFKEHNNVWRRYEAAQLLLTYRCQSSKDFQRNQRHHILLNELLTKRDFHMYRTNVIEVIMKRAKMEEEIWLKII